MHEWMWSDSEKKLACRVYDDARLAELAETLVEFKIRAAALTSIEDLWPLEDYLRSRRQDLEEKYAYRYSRLGMLFARLIREGRVKPAQLAGLSEEKRSDIVRLVSL